MERKYINHRRGHCVGVHHVHLSSSVPVRVHSESLLSELDPLELLLADSEELLLLSLDGPPEGAEPDFSFLVGFLLFSCPLTSCSRFSSSFFFPFYYENKTNTLGERFMITRDTRVLPTVFFFFLLCGVEAGIAKNKLNYLQWTHFQ